MKNFAAAILAMFVVSNNAIKLADLKDAEAETNADTFLPQFLATSAELALALVKGREQDAKQEDKKSEDADHEDGQCSGAENADSESEEEDKKAPKVPEVSVKDGVTEVCIPEEEEGCTLTMAVDTDKGVIKFKNVPDEELDLKDKDKDKKADSDTESESESESESEDWKSQIWRLD